MQPKALDLFAGCGGLSLGLSEAGWNVVAANEIDQWAADTYRFNHPGVKMMQGDIRSLSSEALSSRFRGKIDLIAGGPPCQGFSLSGKRQYGEVKDQNSLVEEFMRAVEAIEPKLVLLENVSGFRTGFIKPGNPVMDYVYSEFTRLGYVVSAKMLQATDYGVPSLRTRWFVIGSRVAMTGDPFPKPTHGPSGRTPYISVEDAIGDLPCLDAGCGVEDCVGYSVPALTSYQKRLRAGSQGVFNHVAMKHTPRLVERFSRLTQGSKGYDLGRSPQNADHEQVTIYKSNNQRLVSVEPSLCITANFQSNYVHPLQNRNLTAREAARLMTYPDRFVFLGKRTLMSKSLLRKYGREGEDFLSQYNQIGNSVPPLLGKAIGVALRKIFEKNSETDGLQRSQVRSSELVEEA